MADTADQLDVRSLRVLAALANTGNTYRAADQLNLSQSAVSRTLGRLRSVLDDPLFVRGPARMEPTEKARHIVARLPELLDLLESVVEGDKPFDPAQWQGNVSIALSSLAMIAWGSLICSQLQKLAPGLVLNLETWGPNTVGGLLDGRITLGIHYRHDKWPQALFQETLVKDQYVLMSREGHPAARARPALDLFRDYPLISLLLPEWNDYDNRLESALAGLAIEPQIKLRTDDLSLALEQLRASDCLMAGTRSMTERLDRIQLNSYPRELQLPDSTAVLCYPRRMRNSSRMNWLAKELKSLVG